jgi:hypothetical protein
MGRPRTQRRAPATTAQTSGSLQQQVPIEQAQRELAALRQAQAVSTRTSVSSVVSAAPSIPSLGIRRQFERHVEWPPQVAMRVNTACRP